MLKTHEVDDFQKRLDVQNRLGGRHGSREANNSGSELEGPSTLYLMFLVTKTLPVMVSGARLGELGVLLLRNRFRNMMGKYVEIMNYRNHKSWKWALSIF